MVMECDFRCHDESRHPTAGEDLGTDRGVGPHDRGILSGQWTGLEENVIGDSDLSEIMERGGPADRLDRRFVQSERSGEARRVNADTLGVAACAVVAVLGRFG